MSDNDSRLEIERQAGKDVVRVRFLDRNILDDSAIQQIADEISQLVDQASMPKLLLDFKGVEHLSSAALGALISINNKVRKKGGQLRLAHIDPQIYEVFVITKLNKLFQIHSDCGQALASFR
jgi:anti-anti-sigma factor